MFLGIDIDTSMVKAVVIDDNGLIVARHGAALDLQHPRTHASEQDPDAWWFATNIAVMGIDAATRRRVRGIGLAGHMHGATLLGADDRMLCPATLWSNGRNGEKRASREAALPDLRAITGTLAMPGLIAPSIMWIRDHEPDLFAAIRTVLLPKDYVRLRMTGNKASDMSNNSGALWLDVPGRHWSDRALARCGLDAEQMPELFEGTDVVGHLRAIVAQEWGMPAVLVAAGGGDDAAAAAGVGVVRDGKALLSLGTAGVFFVATDTFQAGTTDAVHAFCHCLPDMWYQMSVNFPAASCVDWVARATRASGVSEVLRRAEIAGPMAGSEVFLPKLSNGRTPYKVSDVRKAFLGLDDDTNDGRLAQAVLEGVAFSLADGLNALEEAGTRVSTLSVIGAGARSAYWGRILAAALETPLTYSDGGEVGPALGAARLARLAVDGGDPGTVCAPPATSHVIEPCDTLMDQLSRKKRLFRRAHSRINPIHRRDQDDDRRLH